MCQHKAEQARQLCLRAAFCGGCLCPTPICVCLCTAASGAPHWLHPDTTRLSPGFTYPRSESCQSFFTSRKLLRKGEAASLPTATNPLDRRRRLNSSTPRVLPYIAHDSRWKFTGRKQHHGAGLRFCEISAFLFPFRGATLFSFFFFFLKEDEEKQKKKRQARSCYAWKR